MNCGLLQCRVLITSSEWSQPFHAASFLRYCTVLALWDKTLPVTALVSPFSAFSSFLTFSIVRVAQECLAQVGGKASEVEEKRLCVNLVLPGSVERCKKLRLRDVAQIEKWCDCLTYVHRRETRGMFRLVRCTLLRCLQVLFFFF